MPEVVVYVGLGSNLDDPQQQVTRALEELAALPLTELDARSSLYRSKPMGPQDQPDYINAVARLRTLLSAEVLLDRLQAIESQHARVRSQHWGPRTLDLDLLLYGENIIQTERLNVPHPGIAERNFVLYPLAEIDGQLEIPGQGQLMKFLQQCPDTGLTRVAARPAAAR